MGASGHPLHTRLGLLIVGNSRSTRLGHWQASRTSGRLGGVTAPVGRHGVDGFTDQPWPPAACGAPLAVINGRLLRSRQLELPCRWATTLCSCGKMSRVPQRVGAVTVFCTLQCNARCMKQGKAACVVCQGTVLGCYTAAAPEWDLHLGARRDRPHEDDVVRDLVAHDAVSAVRGLLRHVDESVFLRRHQRHLPCARRTVWNAHHATLPTTCT